MYIIYTFIYVSIELYFYFPFDVTIKIRVKVYDMTYICCAYNNDNILLLILYATYGQFMLFYYIMSMKKFNNAGKKGLLTLFSDSFEL